MESISGDISSTAAAANAQSIVPDSTSKMVYLIHGTDLSAFSPKQHVGTSYSNRQFGDIGRLTFLIFFVLLAVGYVGYQMFNILIAPRYNYLRTMTETTWRSQTKLVDEISELKKTVSRMEYAMLNAADPNFDTEEFDECFESDLNANIEDFDVPGESSSLAKPKEHKDKE